MTDIAKHIRIFNPSPDDEYVKKRTIAISAIEAVIKKKTGSNEMFALANNIIQSINNPELLSSDIKIASVRALQKASTSFVEDGEQLQISTCVFLAAQRFLEKSKPNNGELSMELIFSLALANGLSFSGAIADKEKLELLRSELQQTAQQKVGTLADIARQRKRVNSEALTVTKENTFVAFAGLLDSSYGLKLTNLNYNAILDREELNILWWALSEWSSIADKQFKELNETQATVLSALEISSLLQKFPGKAHVQLSCKYSTAKAELTGDEVFEQIEGLSAKIQSSLNNAQMVQDYPSIFPVLTLLSGGKDNPGLAVKRSLLEWAGRIIWERAMLNINKIS